MVAVLGYSERGRHELHPICAARLSRAAEISTADDVVVLSGWSQAPVGHTEAALMARAWSGPAAEVVVDEGARSTVENVATAAGVARQVGARELVVVTSRWHAPRAVAAARWLVRGSGIRVVPMHPVERGSRRLRLREAALWLLLPAQLRRAGSDRFRPHADVAKPRKSQGSRAAG